MARLDIPNLPPLNARPADAATSEAGAAGHRDGDAAALELARREWRSELDAVTAVARTLDDAADRAALASEARQASTKIAEASVSADPGRQLALYRNAITQLRVATAVAVLRSPAPAASFHPLRRRHDAERPR